uniref:Uncharacterized protein n=1 Tax=Hyaloperonospora arabidopsidis (strain Emoy2) TaxID=559515 RepID=M4B7E1_HYAAE
MESTNTRRSGNRESAGTCICPPRRRVFKSLPPVDNTGNGRFKSAPRCRIRMIWITLFRSCGIGVVVRYDFMTYRSLPLRGLLWQ